MTLPALIQETELKSLQTIAKHFIESGMFPDIKNPHQALVKILAGREFGLGPFEAMRSIDIIQGKTAFNAAFISSKIKASGKYDYVIERLDDTGCVLQFTQDGKALEPKSSFLQADAERAGLLQKGGGMYQKYPRNMYFARALTNGARWFCADVFGGAVYTPDEIRGGVMHQELDVTPVAPVVKAVAPQPAPKEPYKGPIQTHAELTPVKAATSVTLSEDELPDWLNEPLEGSIDDLNALDTQKIRESLEAQALEPVVPTNPGDFTFSYGYYHENGTRLGDLEGKPHLIESYVRKFRDRESPEFLAAVQALYRQIGYDSSKWSEAVMSRKGQRTTKQQAKEFLNQVNTYEEENL